MKLSEAWEARARDWIAWVRKPGHDSYDRYHRDQFLPLVPSPARRTLDVGCGEGRLTRHLASLGHRVVGVDASPTLIAAARESAPEMELHVADACALPFADASFDRVVSFMCLHDVDDLGVAVDEIARVLEPGGVVSIAVVHPINSAGRFEKHGRFVIRGSYLESFRYSDTVERDGLTMTFESQHRPISAYVDALAGAGLVLDALREPVTELHESWSRVPLFLHLRARNMRRMVP
jgi:ubiquinone/menaquinone biosynthesis C-methylase UbiE